MRNEQAMSVQCAINVQSAISVRRNPTSFWKWWNSQKSLQKSNNNNNNNLSTSRTAERHCVARGQKPHKMYFFAEEIWKGWYKRNHFLICKIDEIPNQFSICRKISEFLCSLSIISRQELRRATNCAVNCKSGAPSSACEICRQTADYYE